MKRDVIPRGVDYLDLDKAYDDQKQASPASPSI